MADNEGLMGPQHIDLVGAFAWRRSLVLLSPMLLVVACVGLDKPKDVKECASKKNCSDNGPITPGTDAKPDTVLPINDLRNEPVPSIYDAMLDSAVVPDSSGDLSIVIDAVNRDGGDTADVAVGETSSSPKDGELDLNVDTAPDSVSQPKDLPLELQPEVGKEPGPEPQPEPPQDSGIPDSAPDGITIPANCILHTGQNPSQGSAGQPPATNALAAFCYATCDNLTGWGCSNFDGRTVAVNGTTVACGASVTKKDGYYIFQVSQGTNKSATVYWWGSFVGTCP
jgi:hypothetical protein